MPRILILGGTRNLGHSAALALLHAGHEVAVLNRGVTSDDLPAGIERIRASREDPAALVAAAKSRYWDAVVDTTSYSAADATNVTNAFRDRCSRLIAVSSGQVYLVRENLTAPFLESGYEGQLKPQPTPGTYDFNQWSYGIEKREMESVFSQSARSDFPVITLRMPMIASERDQYGRIQAYIARALDGGPILVPTRNSLPIRHLYVEDAAEVIVRLCTDKRAGAQSYNISYGHSISLQEFFALLRDALDKNVHILPVDVRELEMAKLLPACSPYSGTWMSELDNGRSVADIGKSTFSYTGPETYLRPIIADYLERWVPAGLIPPGYERRRSELELAKKAQ